MARGNSRKGRIVWFLGLSGAGKTTIATRVASLLGEDGRLCYLLDGDEVRRFYGDDLGYSRQDRIANIKRIGFTAMVLASHDVLVLVANICPYEEMRTWLSNRLPTLSFVYISTDLATCKERDTKNVYQASKEVIGVHEAFEVPQNPALVIDAGAMDSELAARLVIDYLHTSNARTDESDTGQR